MWSLNLTTSIENNAIFITNEFLQLKLKNTCADIENEAVEISPISVVNDVDKCGVLGTTCVEKNIYFNLICPYQKLRILVIIMMHMK